MRLSEFILTEMEAIVAEWEAYAATLLPAAADMSARALRNHAEQILEAVAKDLTTPQTRNEQTKKSKGLATGIPGAPDTAAQTHAVLRARSGFDINQLVAEYRALRASVLRLWLDSRLMPLDASVFEDLIRFNEAIDQAVAESVGHFHRQVERSRDLFLGMLGHDMRSPLNTIVMTAWQLANLKAGDQVSQGAARLIRSGAAMQALLDDLVEFNRTSLGLGMKVVPTDIDMTTVVTDELEQLRGAYPERRIEFTATGDPRGRWDAMRVQQLVRNLVSNAVRYADSDTAVDVSVRGEDADAVIEVTNHGAAIDSSVQNLIFDPLQRGLTQGDDPDPSAGLGLGLFIVREIAKAHGGEVEVQSDGGKTTFMVRLPR